MVTAEAMAKSKMRSHRAATAKNAEASMVIQSTLTETTLTLTGSARVSRKSLMYGPRRLLAISF